MFLLPIRKGKWNILTTCDNCGNSPLLDFLEGLDEKYYIDRDRLLALLETISGDAQGPRLLRKTISHHVDKNGKIFQLTARKLRLLYFYSENDRKVIICSHSFIKTTQKTPVAETKKAEELRVAYHEAQRSSRIKMVDT